MSEPLTGLDEAVEAAARTDYEHIVGIPLRKSAQPWDKLTEDHRRSYRLATGRMLNAAYPIIAAAVRADERAKWASVRQAEWDEGYAAGYHAGYEAATS